MIEEKELIRTQLFVNIYILNDCFSENCEDILFVTTDCTEIKTIANLFIKNLFKTFGNLMLLLSVVLLMIYFNFIIETISLVINIYT